MQDCEVRWIHQAQQGDPDAFSKLVETYQRPVFNMCYRMLNNAEDAEDAAQETFLRAYKGLRRYDEQRSFPTWLLSIAAHYCIDQMRKQRMTFVSVDDDPEIDIPDNAPVPESSLTRSQEQQKVRLLLEKLNPTDRAAVVMYYWYDFSYDEISHALSLTESAIKSRLHRARREMAQTWQNNQTQVLLVERKRNDHAKSPAF